MHLFCMFSCCQTGNSLCPDYALSLPPTALRRRQPFAGDQSPAEDPTKEGIRGSVLLFILGSTDKQL
jgi:hypothetical protein